MQRLERTEYLEKLKAFQDKRLIKIITGIRRCGKSTLMEIYQDYLRGNGVSEEQIVAVNFEDYDFHSLRNPQQLHAYVKERLIPGKKVYVFLDEIQHVEDWPQVVDSLFLRDGLDLYLTGSNAYLLSSELATMIAGRYVEIKMLPLSFREYVQAVGEAQPLSQLYRSYVETTSFPYGLELQDQPRALRDYLEGIYNTVVVKNLVARKRIPDVMMLESVTRFLFDAIGSPLSTKKIADTMTSMGRKIDVKTVEKYVSALMESFIIYQAKRYNVKGKQYLKTLEKYYMVDMGLRYMLLGTRSTDVGHMLENVVYLELLRRGYEVYVGKVDDLEVDFVAMDGREIRYYQVAATVREEETLRRELASLQKINDHYPKRILTLDDDPEADYDGIRRIHALEWLMGKVD
ncbi:ATPase [Pseudoflavonifractor sp. An44]|uniref:ATP-binding protein n=1 Tax=Pseudoflavonifractor sp. An44 TaxID=1965635 RepID=UPI000B36FB74|nr:ATP-binding protein [Pseudoflavonifractor sp. An44]OUN97358.1 ATPase [Pseudoflavonifractor sp. An44]